MKFAGVFRKIAHFDSTVKRMTVVKNSDPFLQKLTEEKDFKKRIEVAKEVFDVLGEGSSRMVFDLPDDRVLKIALNEKGIDQNLFESHPKMQTECTNKVLVADPEGKWLIVKKAKSLTEKRFKEMVGFTFDEFTDALFYKFNNESDMKRPKKYEEIVEHPLYKCLLEMMVGSDDLQLGDVMRISSWGEVNDKPLLIDIGLSREIYKEHYK